MPDESVPIIRPRGDSHQESDQVQIARINADVEKARLDSRHKTILAVVTAVSSVVSPLAIGAMAWWTSRIDTKVEAVQATQAENAGKIDAVKGEVDATSHEVKATRQAVNDRKKEPPRSTMPAPKEDE